VADEVDVSEGKELLHERRFAYEFMVIEYHPARPMRFASPSGSRGGRRWASVPAGRVGLHAEPAMAREDDWLGATVNVASRVWEAAAAGEVLFTDATRSAAADVEGIEYSHWDRARFKNVRQPRASGPPRRLGGRWPAAGLSSTPCAGWRLRRNDRRERLASAPEAFTLLGGLRNGVPQGPERHLIESAS
jgi:hypothetical protein